VVGAPRSTLQASWRHFVVTLGESDEYADSEQDFKTFVKTHSNGICVAVYSADDEHTIAAQIFISVADPHNIELCSWSTIPQMRGQGFGKAVLRHARTVCDTLYPNSQVSLWTRKTLLDGSPSPAWHCALNNCFKDMEERFQPQNEDDRRMYSHHYRLEVLSSNAFKMQSPI